MDHLRSRAPNHLFVKRHKVHLMQVAFASEFHLNMIFALNKKLPRHLKCVFDFVSIDSQLIIRVNEADKWGDNIIRHRSVMAHFADDIDQIMINADFFLGFAQGGVTQGVICGFKSTTGKANLTRVVS